MTSPIRLALLGLALVLLLGLGAWYYLFGPNKINAAELVPSDTVLFATIPNAAELTAGYQTSHLKELIDSPDAKPLVDAVRQQLGQKNLDLLMAFLPCMSGQSFIAVTHIDPAHLEKIGFVAGLKPKPGAGNFNAFVDMMKAAYPQVLSQATTGNGQIEGLDYQWLQGPGGSDKFCVAQVRGWIVTAWGEDSLRDWWERFQKKSSTPSLFQNADYQKSLDRVGKKSETILYADSHALLGLLQQRLAAFQPAKANYLTKKWQGLGALAIGTSFEQSDIVDHLSTLMPHQAQVDAGVATPPCAFDTLKFTGPDTCFYWAASTNWAQTWKNLQEQARLSPGAGPDPMASMITGLQNWARSENIDIQRNIIDPLGNEVSLQAEWDGDTAYPEIAFLAKLDKPDDFKPTVAAFVDTVRKLYETTAVVTEINSNGQNFAALKFVQSLPITPTITEDGPYFGLFLTENQAVRVFQRDATVGLLNNADFKRQIGDKPTGANQLLFLDSPRILNHAYQAALPYLSLAAMFNRTLGSVLQGQKLPPDLQWLAPMGTWSCVSSIDDDGFKSYSISGIGNQGLFLAGGLVGGISAWHTMGLPLGFASPFLPPPAPVVPPAPLPPVAPTPGTTTNAAPAPIAPTPDVTTNAAPPPTAPTPGVTTNAAPAIPDSSTNAPTPSSTPAPQ